MKQTILVFVLLFSIQVLNAQNFTIEDSVFFDCQKKTFIDFLNKKGISQAIDVSRLRIQTVPTHVILRLYSASGDNWLGLRQSMENNGNKNVERMIFDKFISLMEVKPEQALFYVHGDDGFKLLSGYDKDKNNSFSIEENKTRSVVTKTFSLPAASKYVSAKTSTKGKFETVKNNIHKILTDFYSQKGTMFRKAKLEVNKYGDEVRADITNISNEIIDDCYICDFELIHLIVKMSEENDNIKLEISVDGKLGSGIYNAPRRSGYREFSEKQQDYIERYARRVLEKLNEELNKKH